MDLAFAHFNIAACVVSTCFNIAACAVLTCFNIAACAALTCSLKSSLMNERVSCLAHKKNDSPLEWISNRDHWG